MCGREGAWEKDEEERQAKYVRWRGCMGEG